MTTSVRARTLATALVLGIAILGSAPGPADQAIAANPNEAGGAGAGDGGAGGPGSSTAEPRRRKPVDNGVRCAVTRSDGYIDFYLPGELARDKYGHWKICGNDGEWHPMARIPDGEGPRTGGGGGVYAP